jgi:hypothetical protein
MPGFVGARGGFTGINQSFIRTGNVWRKVSVAYAKVNGEWKEIYVPPPNVVSNFEISGFTNDSVSFIWDPVDDVSSYRLYVSATPHKEYEDPSPGAQVPASYVLNQTIAPSVISGTGTIFMPVQQKIITGIGTSFLSQVKVNEKLYVVLNSVKYEVGTVASIESNTKLTLSENWIEQTVSTPGVSFTIAKKRTATINPTQREYDYKFYVSPLTVSLAEGIKSSILTRRTPISPPTQRGLGLKSFDTRTSATVLRWAKDTRASVYEIYHNRFQANPANFVLKTTVEPNGTNEETYAYTDGVETDYLLYVVGRNIIEESDPDTIQRSAPSNTVAFSYRFPELGPMSLSGSSTSYNTATFSWTDTEGATNFALQVKEGAGAWTTVQNISTSTAIDVNRLTASYTFNSNSTTYYVRVAASGPNYNIGYSNEVTITTGRPLIQSTVWEDRTKSYAMTRTYTKLRTRTATTNFGGTNVSIAWEERNSGEGATGVSTSSSVIGSVQVDKTETFYTTFHIPITSSNDLPTGSRYKTSTFRFRKQSTTTRTIGIWVGARGGATSQNSLNRFITTRTLGQGAESVTDVDFYNYLDRAENNAIIFSGSGSPAFYDSGDLDVFYEIQVTTTTQTAQAMSVSGNR